MKTIIGRHPKDLDTDLVKSFIKRKNVLITGAGGSIGSEIARQCKNFDALSLTLLDNSEYNLYNICEELPEARGVLDSVTDLNSLNALFSKQNFDIVIHAAAYKHVPMCETNKESAVKNNVLGTKNIIDVSIENSVQKVVIISTDKAVRPTNVMGATKRVGELYAQNVDSKETEIVAVRFGNVLGSSGSVIPKFKRQIESGGPVTVTHPDMKRYFMLVDEACQLVLQASAIAKGGEIFILDMGEPVMIDDIAKQMVSLYGHSNIPIVYTGLRPGEKMFEEIMNDYEQETRYKSIHIAQPTEYPINTLTEDIKTLLTTDDKVKSLKNIVPEFNHQP